MAMPTAVQFKARFPAFEAVSNTLIDAVLAETDSFVDHTWIAADIANARMYLAAHMLVSEGALMPEAAQVGGAAGLASVSVGDTSVSLKGDSSSMTGSDAMLARTSYGQMFLMLRRRSVPAVAVAK